LVRYDVRRFTRQPQGRLATVWWGMAGLILLEAMVVASVVAGNFYLQLMNAQWPPPNAAPPAVLDGALVLALLLAGSAALMWAVGALAKGAQPAFLGGLLLTLAAGVAAAWMLLRQFGRFAVRWDEHAYGSVLWTVNGLQLAHVAAALVALSMVLVMAVRGFFTPRRDIGVTAVAMYWHFVALSWIPLYLALYWVPRWL